MKLFYYSLVLVVSITCNVPNALASKNSEITPIHTVAVVSVKETVETSNHATIVEEKSDLKKKEDKKTDTKKAKRYRGGNSTRRIIIIAAIAIAAVAIIIYVVASASVTKN